MGDFTGDSLTKSDNFSDIAIMDDEGYVTITGRIKDMIIRGGENIYPVEIEQFIYTVPAVEDVQVIGEHRLAPSSTE